MNVLYRLLIFSAVLTVTVGSRAHAGKHLFILSGQSNMQGHRPEEAFAPAVEEAYGQANVVIVQDALGGQPIYRWYKKWEDPNGDDQPTQIGDLYDRLMNKVQAAIEGKKLSSVTFIWMQGERDAKMKWSSAYEESLRGLYKQISRDLGRDDINFVIGRLSDFDMNNSRYPDWTNIRDIQVKVAQSNPRFAWVNTDDLNDGTNRRGKEISNDLHYSGEGYKILGKRFAEASVELIQRAARSN